MNWWHNAPERLLINRFSAILSEINSDIATFNGVINHNSALLSQWNSQYKEKMQDAFLASEAAGAGIQLSLIFKFFLDFFIIIY